MRQQRDLGLGSRMAGGGGGVTISRAIAEREIAWRQKNSKCSEIERGA
jgi:hypothetical protein